DGDRRGSCHRQPVAARAFWRLQAGWHLCARAYRGRASGSRHDAMSERKRQLEALALSRLTQAPVIRVLDLLNRDGEEARIVGGAVRNALLGLPPGDIDIATTLLPDAVMRRAADAGLHAMPTGIEHGTVTLVVDEHPFEVTTLREDVE